MLSALRATGAEVRIHRSASAAAGDSPADVRYAPFTDALWGPDIDSAAAAFCAWAASSPTPVVVALHDVPGADRDTARDARRVAGYVAVLHAAAGAVVSSAYERQLAEALGETPVAVVPLPIVSPTVPPTTVPPTTVPPTPVPPPVGASARAPLANVTAVGSSEVTLGVLGWLYPGKGHAAAIELAGGLAACGQSAATVLALGAASPGHERLPAELAGLARERGVRLRVTGELTDAELHRTAAAVTVPLALPEAVSASASLCSWLAAGRRPLTAAHPHAVELATAAPGWVWLLPDDPAARVRAVRAAIADPALTRPAIPAFRPPVGRLTADFLARVVAGQRTLAGASA